jgi:hypothetical protein
MVVTLMVVLWYFCKLQKGCTRLAAASDKAYQLLAHGRWFSPGTPASSTTKTGHHVFVCEDVLTVSSAHWLHFCVLPTANESSTLVQKSAIYYLGKYENDLI